MSPTPRPRPTRRRRHSASVPTAAATALAAVTLSAVGAAPAMAAGPICATFERAAVNDGALVVQNNAWGDTPRQCVQPRDGGFTITTAEGDLEFGGAPKSYPSIFAGEHYGQSSDTDALPVKVSDIGNARTSARITEAGGAWNAAYDIWVNTTPDSPEENDDTEIMIWADTRGGPTPIGDKVDTITAEGRSYDVWKGTGPGGTDVVSYVDTQTTTRPDLALAPFFEDAVARGATSPDSWMTSIQLGFEPWKGGAGLAIDDFTYTPNGAPTAEPADEDKGQKKEKDETTAPRGDDAPADVLDLTAVHLTLPTSKDGKAKQVAPTSSPPSPTPTPSTSPPAGCSCAPPSRGPPPRRRQGEASRVRGRPHTGRGSSWGAVIAA